MADSTASTDAGGRQITMERTYSASAQDIWDLWTTREGIESWWAPDGFSVEVRELDLRPGGRLLYAMTAVTPDMIEFMNRAGMPVSTEAGKTFTEVVARERLAYLSLADFIPGVEPYESATVVELEAGSQGVRLAMTVEPMHDDVWTGRLVKGRENELDNLARLIG